MPAALRNNPEPNFTVISRQYSEAIDEPGTRVIKVADSYTANELLEAFKGQDAIISTMPAHSTQTEIAFINAAVQTGIKRFIASESGGSSQNAKYVEIFPMLTFKIEVVNYLKSKEETGLTWTAIATGTFFNLYILNSPESFLLLLRSQVIPVVYWWASMAMM